MSIGFLKKLQKSFSAEKKTLHCITENTVFKKFLDAGSIENTTFLKSLGSKNFVKTWQVVYTIYRDKKTLSSLLRDFLNLNNDERINHNSNFKAAI